MPSFGSDLRRQRLSRRPGHSTWDTVGRAEGVDAADHGAGGVAIAETEASVPLATMSAALPGLPRTRGGSTILNFITEKASQIPGLAELNPDLIKRFRSRPPGKDFAGSDPNQPLPEVFRLVCAMAALGPLPDDVWDYLLNEAAESESTEMQNELAGLAEGQGPAGTRLMAKLRISYGPSYCGRAA